MGALLVTVDGPHQRRQLSLPDDWPIRDLLPVLVDFVGEGGGDAGLWALRYGSMRLPEEQSLTACGVGDGATLVLDRLPARIPLPVDDVVVRPNAPPPWTDPVPTPARETPSPTPVAAPAMPSKLVEPTQEPMTRAPRRPKAPAQASSGTTPTEAPPAHKLPQGMGGAAVPAPPPRQSQPSSRRGRHRAGVVGAVALLALLAGGAWWAFARPRPQPPAPPRAQASPVTPPTRGLPPIAHLSAVVHGTIVGTDSIQVGYFARTPEGATEAGHNYLWAIAGTDDASTLLEQITVRGQARALAAAAQESKDLLLEQFYLGFRNAQPQLPRYTLDEATISVPVTGQTFLVYLRWVPDPTGGDWKLASVQRPDPGAPPAQPAPS